VKTETEIAAEQAGFRQGRGARDKKHESQNTDARATRAPTTTLISEKSAYKAHTNRCMYGVRRKISVSCQLLSQVGRWHARREIRYDTIRDAILTCARKPTRVSFILECSLL